MFFAGLSIGVMLGALIVHCLADLTDRGHAARGKQPPIAWR
jgi:hypothetical protein